MSQLKERLRIISFFRRTIIPRVCTPRKKPSVERWRVAEHLSAICTLLIKNTLFFFPSSRVPCVSSIAKILSWERKIARVCLLLSSTPVTIRSSSSSYRHSVFTTRILLHEYFYGPYRELRECISREIYIGNRREVHKKSFPILFD